MKTAGERLRDSVEYITELVRDEELNDEERQQIDDLLEAINQVLLKESYEDHYDNDRLNRIVGEELMWIQMDRGGEVAYNYNPDPGHYFHSKVPHEDS